jgi:hypothetical protein
MSRIFLTAALSIPLLGQTPSLPTVQTAFIGDESQISQPAHVRLKPRLRSTLHVLVCREPLEAWVSATKLTAPPELFLHMDGRAMNLPASKPEVMSPVGKTCPCKTTDGNGECTSAYRYSFYLDPKVVADPAKREPWLRVLENPGADRPARVSLAPDNSPLWPSTVTLHFERVDTPWAWGVGVVLLFLAVLFFFIGTDTLRDKPDKGLSADQKPTFSLARVQMAVWTFLVVAAFAFVFLVTQNYNTLTPGVLVLIGIASGTTLAAATIQKNPSKASSGNFWTDILSEDGASPTFARFQALLFTVILGIIFVSQVLYSLVMPEFNGTLLGLMGISSGTYLGFKINAEL